MDFYDLIIPGDYRDYDILRKKKTISLNDIVFSSSKYNNLCNHQEWSSHQKPFLIMSRHLLLEDMSFVSPSIQ